MTTQPDLGPGVHGALQRVVGDMTIGTLAAYERERQRRAATAMGDVAQHFRLPINGKVKSYVTWGQLDLNFSYPFLYAPGRTFDNHHDTPHYTQGYEHTSGDPVIVHAHVIGWKFSAEGWCVGATVRYGVQSGNVPFQAASPAAPAGVGSLPPEARPHSFGGVLHMTFTGFASPVEDVVDDGV